MLKWNSITPIAGYATQPVQRGNPLGVAHLNDTPVKPSAVKRKPICQPLDESDLIPNLSRY